MRLKIIFDKRAEMFLFFFFILCCFSRSSVIYSLLNLSRIKRLFLARSKETPGWVGWLLSLSCLKTARLVINSRKNGKGAYFIL